MGIVWNAIAIVMVAAEVFQQGVFGREGLLAHGTPLAGNEPVADGWRHGVL